MLRHIFGLAFLSTALVVSDLSLGAFGPSTLNCWDKYRGTQWIVIQNPIMVYAWLVLSIFITIIIPVAILLGFGAAIEALQPSSLTKSYVSNDVRGSVAGESVRTLGLVGEPNFHLRSCRIMLHPEVQRNRTQGEWDSFSIRYEAAPDTSGAYREVSYAEYLERSRARKYACPRTLRDQLNRPVSSYPALPATKSLLSE
jgi:hypothetical protein